MQPTFLGYIYASDFVTSYPSEVTNGANQSLRLKGFIGTNFISIRKAQRKLGQVTSGVWQWWKVLLFTI